MRDTCEPKTNTPRYLRFSNAASALLWLVADYQVEQGNPASGGHS